MSGVPYCRKCRNQFYVSDIEKDTLENERFGPVVQHNDPSGHIQVALMSVEPGQTVPREIHSELSQFIRVEAGMGRIILNDIPFDIFNGTAAVIPAGTWHEIVNTGQGPLKFYTLYCKDSAAKFEH